MEILDSHFLHLIWKKWVDILITNVREIPLYVNFQTFCVSLAEKSSWRYFNVSIFFEHFLAKLWFVKKEKKKKEKKRKSFADRRDFIYCAFNYFISSIKRGNLMCLRALLSCHFWATPFFPFFFPPLFLFSLSLTFSFCCFPLAFPAQMATALRRVLPLSKNIKGTFFRAMSSNSLEKTVYVYTDLLKKPEHHPLFDLCRYLDLAVDLSSVLFCCCFLYLSFKAQNSSWIRRGCSLYFSRHIYSSFSYNNRRSQYPS